MLILIELIFKSLFSMHLLKLQCFYSPLKENNLFSVSLFCKQAQEK